MSTIFRVHKNKDFTVMSNTHLYDMRLSLKAVGLLSMILSLPSDWDYTLSGLAKLSSDGIDSVRAAVRELEKCGYITRRQQRGKDGKIFLKNALLHLSRSLQIYSRRPRPFSAPICRKRLPVFRGVS